MIDNRITVVRGRFQHFVHVCDFFNLLECVYGLRHNVLREELAHKVRGIPVQEGNELGLVVRVEDAWW
jgi:hypothetical protein